MGETEQRDAWPLVVVLGPTASGKSALGIALARRLGGEVLACDSTQVYRHFDIGTGKLRAEEQAGIPHHLIDLLEPEELFTAGDYQRAGRAALAEVRARGHIPIVTAGTGLYLRALLEGLSSLPPRAPELRARLQERAEERGSEYLHRLLARVDPGSAGAIGPRDAPKLVRALEVCLLARRPRTELFAAGRERLEG
ncbi:MAG: tRNA (adenosine(37)-N6)-dimethylallyltransferase MiaA, partial [Acidobacteria bacterium]|nr:tRNA (adenosine(37)-N6)-dimethylallyltransferase MiaA [Acidobacteriota bacterium]